MTYGLGWALVSARSIKSATCSKLRALLWIAGGGKLVFVFCDTEKIGLSRLWEGVGGVGSEPDVAVKDCSDLTGEASLEEEFTYWGFDGILETSVFEESNGSS